MSIGGPKDDAGEDTEELSDVDDEVVEEGAPVKPGMLCFEW